MHEKTSEITEYEAGDLFKWKNSIFILARTTSEYDGFCLVGLGDGNRFKNPTYLSSAIDGTTFFKRGAKIKIE